METKSTISKEFIQRIMHKCTYQKKEGTQTSYYWQAGAKIMPNRIGISIGEMRETAMKGRNLGKEISGQLMGTFTKKEESPFKVNKPYVVRTQLWQAADFPKLEYGTLAMSNEKGIIDRDSDKGDLIVAYRPNHKDIHFWIFPAIGANPDSLLEALQYVDEEMKKGAF